jgi:outer membrane immunogenic protein
MFYRIIFALSAGTMLAAGIAQGAFAAPLAYNWTGFYVGANAGWAFVNADTSGHKLDPSGFGSNRTSSASQSWDGFIGGGQIGFNWMALPSVVLGIEADFSGADLKLDSTGVSNDGTSYKSTSLESIATVRGRAGYAANNWLIFGTGGAAWTHVHLTNTQGPCNPDPTCAGGPVPLGTTDSNTTDVTGWTAGGGIEYGITPNWTAKIEYLHMDFGSFTSANPSFNRANDVQLKTDVVRVGANYRFGVH